MKIKTKSKKVNRAWLNDHVNDPYVKLAQKEGYRARAAYKLKEIDEALGLIKPGHLVVDLGSAPGRLEPVPAAQARRPAARRRASSTAPSSRWTSCPWSRSRACTFIQGDFREPEVLAQLEAGHGRAARPTWWCPTWRPTCRASSPPTRPASRTWSSWPSNFAGSHMKPEGALVTKVFHGSGYSQLVKLFKETFRTVKPLKPKASRDKSSETFLVGIGLKPAK